MITPADMLNFSTNGLWQVLAAAALSLLITTLLLKVFRGGGAERFFYYTQVTLITLIGWGLILYSSVFNHSYTVGMMQGSTMFNPSMMGKLAVLVNLMGGVALHAGAINLVKGKRTRAIFYFIGYFPILIYSLTAASSTLLTGDSTQRFNLITSELQQAKYKQDQENAKEANQLLRNNTGTLPSTFTATTMTNSNGTRVSIARHCKPNTWYANNRPVCRQYLSALANSGRATIINQNNSKIAAARQREIDERNRAPQVMKSNLFDLIHFTPGQGIMMLVLVMEIAAVTALVYAVLEFPAPPPKRPAPQRSKTQRKTPKQGSTPGPQKQGSEGSALKNNDLPPVKESKPAPPKKVETAGKTYYKKANMAVEKTFLGKPVINITATQLDGFLSHMAQLHPNEPAIAKRLIEDLRTLLGTSVGKETMRSALGRNVECVDTHEPRGPTLQTMTFKDESDVDVEQNPVRVMGSTRRADPLSELLATQRGTG